MQKLHMQMAGILCSACVQSAAPPAELAATRVAVPFTPPDPVAPSVSVAPALTGLIPALSASANGGASVVPDAGHVPLVTEQEPPETQQEVWPAPPLASEACAERTVLLQEWAAATPERATVSIEYEGARLLQLNLEGCPFIAPPSGQSWSVPPGTYRLYFTFEANIARRAKITLGPGKNKHIRVKIH
jgi:hypothetical protein